jgi:subtilisin family serine protease
MSFDTAYRDRSRRVTIAAIVLVSLVSLPMLACRNPQVPPPRAQETPPKPEHETFRGVDVAPKQVLIKLSSCEGESQDLVSRLTEFSRQITDDGGVQSARATNTCWFLVTSSSLPVSTLMERFNQAISNKRPLVTGNVSITVVHAEPNFHFQVNPSVEGQGSRVYPAGSPSPSAAPSPAPSASIAVSPVGLPNDPYYQDVKLWGLKNSVNPGIDVHAESAWGLSNDSSGIVVGVIDTGIYYDHPDLAANVWKAPSDFDVMVGGTMVHCLKDSHGFNAVTTNPLEMCNPVDAVGHGTHVAGIIGAVGNNGEGIVGVNWRTKLLGLKAFGVFNTATALSVNRAIEFAAQLKDKLGNDGNVRVLNASFGYLETPSNPAESLLLDEGIQLAGSKDMLVVASAGENDGNDNDATHHYPSSLPFPNVISVTAIDSTGALATISGSLSNHGKTSVHLGAPGKGIWSTYPPPLGDTYYRNSGTSMATPFVSGAAALMLSLPACSSLNAVDLKNRLAEGVDKTDSLKDQTVSGGTLNVFRSMQLCTGGGP